MSVKKRRGNPIRVVCTLLVYTVMLIILYQGILIFIRFDNLKPNCTSAHRQIIWSLQHETAVAFTPIPLITVETNSVWNSPSPFSSVSYHAHSLSPFSHHAVGRNDLPKW